MKYTNEHVQKLDAQTIDFCCRWVWDALKRRRMTENDGKTKAKREYAHDSNNGIEFALLDDDVKE